MRKVIYASTERSRYSSNVDKFLKHLEFLGQHLHDVAEAADDDEAKKVAETFGGYFKNLETQEEIVDEVMTRINNTYKDYLRNREAASNYWSVKNQLIKYLQSKGYPMTKLSKSDWGDEAYVIVPADKAEFGQLNEICKDLRNEFPIEWDTPLSGSWTGHSSDLDGVGFTVSIERDYDYDPSGKESSIQLYF